MSIGGHTACSPVLSCSSGTNVDLHKGHGQACSAAILIKLLLNTRPTASTNYQEREGERSCISVSREGERETEREYAVYITYICNM